MTENRWNESKGRSTLHVIVGQQYRRHFGNGQLPTVRHLEKDNTRVNNGVNTELNLF